MTLTPSIFHLGLFAELDSRSDLGIINYGVSMTTLEDVFLRLEAEAEVDQAGKTDVQNFIISGMKLVCLVLRLWIYSVSVESHTLHYKPASEKAHLNFKSQKSLMLGSRDVGGVLWMLMIHCFCFAFVDAATNCLPPMIFLCFLISRPI